VDWMPSIFTALPNKTESIASALEIAWCSRIFGLSYLNSFYLQNHNRKATREWLSYLSVCQ